MFSASKSPTSTRKWWTPGSCCTASCRYGDGIFESRIESSQPAGQSGGESGSWTLTPSYTFSGMSDARSVKWHGWFLRPSRFDFHEQKMPMLTLSDTFGAQSAELLKW